MQSKIFKIDENKIFTIDGRTYIRAGDLIINPENKKYYNNPKKEKENQEALGLTMEIRRAQGLPLLEQPVVVDFNTFIVDIGNSRTGTILIKYGPDEPVWVVKSDEKNNQTHTQRTNVITDSNVFREHGFNEKYNIISTQEENFKKDHSRLMKKFELEDECKKWKISLKSYEMLKEIVKERGNTQDIIDLDNEESEFGKSLKKVYETIMDIKSESNLPNPNAIDFDALNKNRPEIFKKAVKDTKKILKIVRNLKLPNDKLGELINIIFNPKLGWEKGQFSGTVSNIVQSCFANAFHSFGYDVQTPIGREGDADMIFPKLSKKGCEHVKVEFKASSIEDGKIKANMRAQQMMKNWHIFVLHQDECKRLAIMMVPVDGKIWKQVKGSNGKKHYTTYKEILKHHGDDVVWLVGKAFKDNRQNIQISYEEF